MNDFILADAGIRQLHARFVDAVWRQDGEAFANCFAEQGEWKIATLHISGRAEIGGLAGKLLGACARIWIIVGTPVLEVDGKTALGRVPCTELAKMKDGTSAMTLGIYHDRYIEEGGAWRFAARHFGLHYRGPADLSERFLESPDFGPPPGMPSADEPTLTRRFA